jgi:isopenicillin N synthase-like dioxygenase
MSTYFAIPAVDLHEFTSRSDASKPSFVAKLGKSLQETGFVRLKNHGLGEKFLDELYKTAARFFSLPYEIKRGYERPEPGGLRGYTSFGLQHAPGYRSPDLKEFFQFGQPDPPLDKNLEFFPNVMVNEVPAFSHQALKLFRGLEKTGKYLLRAIALYLQLEENYFDDWITDGDSILRIIHYPPIIREPQSSLRAAEHEDINLVTLQTAASWEGLEFMDHRQLWNPLITEPEDLIINVGDMLQRLTNNQLSSVTHRVVNPPKEKWNQSRYSMLFFLYPKANMPLHCRETGIPNSGTRAYPNITAGEYLKERQRETGLSK